MGKLKVISVVATKGGVGKSTTAVNLAVEGSRLGYKTVLIDCDLQESSVGWRALRQQDDIVAMSIPKATVHKDVPKLEGAFDLVIIDCGGETVSPVITSAMAAASNNGIVIIPVLPSVIDVWATDDTVKALRQVRGHQDVEARFLMNQVMAGRLMAKDVAESLAEYAEEVPPLRNQLYFREAYKKAFRDGLGVVEYTDHQAKGELSCVFDEIISILDSKGGE